MNPWDHLDLTVRDDVRFFFEKINERNLHARGLVPAYEAPSLALGPDVEYFSSQITLDDRMLYIMRHIVTHPTLSAYNKLGNTVISHFYGARGIHSVLTDEPDPDKAHVDFEQLAREQKDLLSSDSYTVHARQVAIRAKKAGKPMWGTTELHTSIQDAGHKFVTGRWGEDQKTPLAVAEWIASWINTGFMDKLLVSKSLGEMYRNLTSQRGIGAYYGYHCATSNSVNPALPFSHDEAFCMPGPGASMTLRLLFPTVDERTFRLGDRVIWIREHQDEIFPDLRKIFHPATHNVVANGIKIFEDEQDELKVYGTEVGLCQYSVYCRLRDNPHLVSKRKVARSESTAPKDEGLESFFCPV